MTSGKQDELPGKFSDKRSIEFRRKGHFTSHGKRIYSIMVELTLIEKNTLVKLQGGTFLLSQKLLLLIS